MQHEVHLFHASAVATQACTGPFRSGNRHAIVAFLRQEAGADHDWDATEGQLNSAGWTQVNFTGAATLAAEDLAGSSEELRGAFDEAARSGFGLVVFEKPVGAGGV